MEEKTASKTWRDSGSTLTFKEWIDRENKKKEVSDNTFIPFENIPSESDEKVIVQESPVQSIALDSSNSVDDATIFGLDRDILIISGVLITGILLFYYLNKPKLV